MSGERLVVDTSALIHLLDGTKAIVDLLNGAEVYASFVTEIEMLSSTGGTAEHLLRKKALLNEPSIIESTSRSRRSRSNCASGTGSKCLTVRSLPPRYIWTCRWLQRISTLNG